MSKSKSNNNKSSEDKRDAANENNLSYSEFFVESGAEKYVHRDYKGAIEDYSKAIDADPTNCSAYYCRALAKDHNLGYTSAEIIEDCRKAWECDPETEEASRALTFGAVVKHNLGDIKGACKDWEKAVKCGNELAKSMLEQHCQTSERVQRANEIIREEKESSPQYSLDDLNGVIVKCDKSSEDDLLNHIYNALFKDKSLSLEFMKEIEKHNISKLADFEDKYAGTYNTGEEFSYQLCKDCGYLEDDSIPTFISSHIDWTKDRKSVV